MGEVMQESIDGAVNNHFEETGTRPAMQPAIKMTNENWKQGDDVHHFRMSALEIPDLDASGITVKMVVAADTLCAETLENPTSTTRNFKDRRKGSKQKTAIRLMTSWAKWTAKPSAEDYPLVLDFKQLYPRI